VRHRAGVLDWDRIRLVVFDVDGTLYRQTPLRLCMARDLLLHAALRRDFRTIAVLRTYRRIRERLGAEGTPGFEQALLAQTAAATKLGVQQVQAIAAEWILRRPLPYVARYRCSGVSELFAGLRRRGVPIGVLSDYPARAKLVALGLSADHVLSASDDHVGRLKPHPRGLQALIAAAGATATATVLIGDRADRDGAAARRAGAEALIRSKRPIEGYRTFADFRDPVFGPLLRPHDGAGSTP